jgi:hypothetical protein
LGFDLSRRILSFGFGQGIDLTLRSTLHRDWFLRRNKRHGNTYDTNGEMEGETILKRKKRQVDSDSRFWLLKQFVGESSIERCAWRLALLVDRRYQENKRREVPVDVVSDWVEKGGARMGVGEPIAMSTSPSIDMMLEPKFGFARVEGWNCSWAREIGLD